MSVESSIFVIVTEHYIQAVITLAVQGIPPPSVLDSITISCRNYWLILNGVVNAIVSVV
jgi:hypothetical protein